MRDKIHIQLEKIFAERYEEWCLYAYMYVKSKVEAEEVVQEVCVNVLLRGSGVEIANLEAYISHAIRNVSLQKIKRSRKFDPIRESDGLFSPSSEEHMIQSEDRLHLQKAISSLPEPSRKVFNRCVVEGQKYKNVAEELEVSVNTVKYHIKKAYKMLRAQMQDVYFWMLYVVISLLS